MRYFKRHWNEDRGDEHADWGSAMYFFEVSDQGDPTRQMEVYANGKVLQYDHQHAADSFGMLADQALDMDEFAKFEIAASEFEHAWSFHRPQKIRED